MHIVGSDYYSMVPRNSCPLCQAHIHVRVLRRFRAIDEIDCGPETVRKYNEKPATNHTFDLAVRFHRHACCLLR